MIHSQNVRLSSRSNIDATGNRSRFLAFPFFSPPTPNILRTYKGLLLPGNILRGENSSLSFSFFSPFKRQLTCDASRQLFLWPFAFVRNSLAKSNTLFFNKVQSPPNFISKMIFSSTANPPGDASLSLPIFSSLFFAKKKNKPRKRKLDGEKRGAPFYLFRLGEKRERREERRRPFFMPRPFLSLGSLSYFLDCLHPLLLFLHTRTRERRW